MIEIHTTGAPNTVQDAGRRGHLDAGISRCGAMDRLALNTGNALLGNDSGAAGIEVAFFPFRLRFARAVAFAVTGAACGATLDGRALPPCWTAEAGAGQVLALSPPRRGARAYVTVAGGIDVPPVMGSRSTDVKGGFGGLAGRGLRRGDRLALAEPAPGPGPGRAGFGAAPPPFAPSGPEGGAVALRVIPAAEFERFDPPSRRALVEAEWRVGQEANRMGYRLGGPTLTLDRPLELLSHGIVPGIVQVPANGQPIVQLADANTCGGYPKIAAVIEADLWRIAQAPIGARLRFAEVDDGEAVRLLREQADWLAALARTAARLRR